MLWINLLCIPERLLPEGKNIVYLIDFGLSKKFKDHKGFHIPYKDNKHLTGTARYASINNHLGIGLFDLFLMITL